MNSTWIEYRGSREQIDEMGNSENGFLLQSSDGRYNDRMLFSLESINFNDVTHYLICKPHPLIDMICQWALTGQPVYYQLKQARSSWATGACCSIGEYYNEDDHPPFFNTMSYNYYFNYPPIDDKE